MKTTFKFPACTLSLLYLWAFFLPGTVKAQYDHVSLETFYEELSPYGDWIRDPQYGLVWRPDVDQEDFRPYYSDGHWEMTRYGNTWVSDYDWGWAPFHYGRWHYGGRKGWLWVPDTQWGPAWVSWRSGAGHYGWAPLGPGMNSYMSLSRIPDYYWVFVPQRSIYYSRYPRYDRVRNMGLYPNTAIINNTYVYDRNRYYTGPHAEEIRRVTRQPVTIHTVKNQRPDWFGNQNYRPQVLRDNRQPGRSSATSPSNDRYPNSDSRVQNPRPQRSTDNSGSRGSNAERSNPLSERPAAQSSSRPNDQRLPASSQRTTRSYDNQESRASQSQRQAGPQGQSTPAQREQSHESRPARQTAPSRPQISTSEASSQRSGRTESQTTDPESSRNQGRPARVQ